MASHILVCLLVVLSLCLWKIETCETTQTCGTQFELEVGNVHSFTSPGFPDPYPPGVQCRWKVTSPKNTIINLQCPTFQVKRTKIGCLDSFYIAGYPEKGNGHNTPICGRRYDLNQNFTNNHLDVYFSSFGAYNASHERAQGFKCNITVFAKSSHEVEEVTDCGMRSTASRIINGSEALLHAYPWQVSLRKLKPSHHWEKTHQYEHGCGGSLISSKWVLTAAHCVEGQTEDDGLVALGDHDIDTGLETEHTIERGVSEIIIHYGYMEGWHNEGVNDIALLKLDRPVEFTHGVSPVCLPTTTHNSKFDGKNTVVTGWGRTEGSPKNKLREVTLPVITNSKCTEMWGFDIYDDQICAYEEGKSGCFGDSGGPLVWQDDEHRYHQIGIVSWGSRTCKESPNVYTRVMCYIDWIEEVTGIHFNYKHHSHSTSMNHTDAPDATEQPGISATPGSITTSRGVTPGNTTLTEGSTLTEETTTIGYEITSDVTESTDNITLLGSTLTPVITKSATLELALKQVQCSKNLEEFLNSEEDHLPCPQELETLQNLQCTSEWENPESTTFLETKGVLENWMTKELHITWIGPSIIRIDIGEIICSPAAFFIDLNSTVTFTLNHDVEYEDIFDQMCLPGVRGIFAGEAYRICIA